MRQDRLTPADVEWLTERSTGDTATGFDAGGWEASVWVLHAMHELPGADSDRTHDDRWRLQIASGRVKRSISTADLDAVIATGVPLGMTEPSRPKPPWRRLRWRQLADRLGIDLDVVEGSPGYWWFPYRSWPVTIAPPCEGSLDRISFESIVDCLAIHSRDGRSTPCRAFHAPTGWWTGGLAVRDTPLGAIPIFGKPRVQEFTPNNFWPLDRTWFDYTDHDLCGTRVSGPATLIDELQRHPELETLLKP